MKIEFPQKKYLWSLYLLLLLVALPVWCSAQFVYVGAGWRGQSTVYHRDLYKKTRISAMSIEAGGIYQVLRFIGVGAKVNIPFAQSFTYSFRDSETTSGATFDGFYSDIMVTEVSIRYVPDYMRYNIRQSAASTFLIRFYLDQEIGIYLDLRYTLMALRENFEFRRERRNAVYHNGDLRGGVISERNIEEEITYLLGNPGLALGIQKRISKYIYLEGEIALDLMNVGNDKFVHSIAYEWDPFDDQHEYVTIESLAPGSHTSLSLQVGLGYFF